jgi:hypothetical protein
MTSRNPGTVPARRRRRKSARVSRRRIGTLLEKVTKSANEQETGMALTFSDDELLAFLDELLPNERASLIEQTLRDSDEFRNRVAVLIRRRDQGGHTVGEIWRRYRLTCPDRQTLGSYLLGVLDEPLQQYIQFHLETIGCRLCDATVTELEEARDADAEQPAQRRRRYFESSAWHLRQRDR